MEILLTLSVIEQILLVVAILAGLVQLFYLIAMAVHRQVVSLWPGIISAACVIAIILI